MDRINDGRSKAFELLVGQAIFLVTQITTAIEGLLGDFVPGPDDSRAPAHYALHFAGQRLALELQTHEDLRELMRRYAHVAPAFPSREAPELYRLLTDEEQMVFTALATNAGLRWWIYANETDVGVDASVVPSQERQFKKGQEAADALMHLDCLIRGWSSEEASDFLNQSAIKLIGCFQSTEPGDAISHDDALPRATGNFEAAKRELRYVTIDLQAADLNPDRGEFESSLREWIDCTIASEHEGRYRQFWKCLLIDAAKRFPWTPPILVPRRISLTTAGDPILRRATRILAMVHELHKAGYQLLRVLPMLSPSGAYWRCCVTFADNIAADGFNIRHFDLEGRNVAIYSTAQENCYFGWRDASEATARQLAALFLERFPAIADKGAGRDWAYVGWLADVIGRAESGGDTALLYLMADFPIAEEELRLWQPPPPPNALQQL